MKVKTIIGIIVRIAIIIAATIGCNIYLQTTAPEVANDLAIQQMENNADANTSLYAYSFLMNYLWVVILIATIILFIPEIIKLIRYIIHKIGKETIE
ncbi:hypothetical protein J6A31_04590 [bacterium]|nr:hypothetical protein [bacterium]